MSANNKQLDNKLNKYNTRGDIQSFMKIKQIDDALMTKLSSYKLPGSTAANIIFCIRKKIGYSRKIITTRQIARTVKRTNTPTASQMSSVNRLLSLMDKMNIISRNKVKGSNVFEYKINTNFEEWC